MFFKRGLARLVGIAGFLLCAPAFADITIPMYLVENRDFIVSIGHVTARQTPEAVLLVPDLHKLPPGAHGMHIHQNPSCLNSGMAAGDHLDPGHTGHHLGPYGSGHLGDLPVLEVDKNGDATTPVLAPHIKKLEELKNHSLIIHAGGDNYSDQPAPLGGGGTRIACGVIQ